MQFLVMGENIDSGYLVPPDQLVGAIEHAVLPSFQMMADLEHQGKVKGGTFPGERAGAFVADAGSYEELDALLNKLPFYGLVKWQVKPLMPFSSMAKQLPDYLKAMRQGGGGPG
ncbi:MAG TPA: muconolactone Delta-isomerase family protein [Chloroflexota bacterium]